MSSGSNIILQFAQIPRGFSQIFKIMPQKKSDSSTREIEISSDLVYRGKYLNGYDLRAFLFLLGQLSAGRKVAKRLNVKHLDVVEMLDAKVSSSRKIVALALEDWLAYTEIKKMLAFFGFEQKWSNGDVVGRSLTALENSYLRSKELGYEGRVIAMDYSRFWLVFNPVFSSLVEKNLPLTTVDLNVAKVLARDVNKLVVYYALCDKVGFGESIRMDVESLFPLWYGNVKSKQVKSKRVHLIKETLDEICKLSNDFRITFYDRSYFSVRRVKNLRSQKFRI